MTNERDHIASLREDNAVLRNRVTDLTRERDEYKIWWERDTKGLGTALNDLSMERACKQDYKAQSAQLRGNLSLAEEGLASATQEIQLLRAGRENAQLINDNAAREIERLRQARLTWAMACHCECQACDTFYEAFRANAPEPCDGLVCENAKEEDAEHMQPLDSAICLGCWNKLVAEVIELRGKVNAVKSEVIPTDAKDTDPVPPCAHPLAWRRYDGGGRPYCEKCGTTL